MIYNNRGVAYLRQHAYKKAIADFNRAIKLNSSFWSAYHNRGQAYSGLGEDEKAIEEFSKVIEANPNRAAIYKDRGIAYRKLGDYDLAVKDFEKAMELDKKLFAARAALGLLYATAKDPRYRKPKKALTLSRKAVRMSGGRNPDMLRNLAEVQMALNERRQAVRNLEKAISLAPDNEEYRTLLKKWGGEAAPGERVRARRREEPAESAPVRRPTRAQGRKGSTLW
jgi:tetratricopeptide (TPR) repeat protein